VVVETGALISIASVTTITQEGTPMSGIYKKVEVVGTSEVSFAEAVKMAVAEAGKTIHHMDWFEVVEERGRIQDGKVAEFQVTIRIGFKLDR
jgi:dodecin